MGFLSQHDHKLGTLMWANFNQIRVQIVFSIKERGRSAIKINHLSKKLKLLLKMEEIIKALEFDLIINYPDFQQVFMSKNYSIQRELLLCYKPQIKTKSKIIRTK